MSSKIKSQVETCLLDLAVRPSQSLCQLILRTQSFFLFCSGNFPMISDDLVNSYHLLLCALDLVLTNALLCNARKDLLNPDFRGTDAARHCRRILKPECDVLRVETTHGFSFPLRRLPTESLYCWNIQAMLAACLSVCLCLCVCLCVCLSVWLYSFFLSDRSRRCFHLDMFRQSSAVFLRGVIWRHCDVSLSVVLPCRRDRSVRSVRSVGSTRPVTPPAVRWSLEERVPGVGEREHSLFCPP